MKIIAILIISILSLTIYSSCQSKGGKIALEEFNAKEEQAKKYFLGGDFEKSEQAYNEAFEIAKEMRWTDGIIISKHKIAKIYLARKDYEKGEALLNELLKLCRNDKDCSSGQMNSLYDSLRFLYLFNLKDENKLRELIKDVNLSKDKFGDEEAKKIICGYAKDIKDGGYSDLSSEIKANYGCE